MEDERVLGRGIRILGLAIRKEPGMFAIAVAGSIVFALLTIATAFVLGAVIGRVVVPAIEGDDVSRSPRRGTGFAYCAARMGRADGSGGRG